VSSLNKLAHQLASPALSHQAIKDGLRVLGFRASIAGLRQALAVSNELYSHFEKLETCFPGSKKILSDFRNSRDIFALVKSAPEFSTSETIRSRFVATPFCAVIGGKEYQAVDFDQFPVLAELLAFFWLVNSSIHSRPDIQISNKLAKLLYGSINFVRELASAVEDHPDLLKQSPALLSENLTEWVDFSANIFSLCTSTFLSVEDVRGAFFEACAQMQRLPSVPIADALPVVPRWPVVVKQRFVPTPRPNLKCYFTSNTQQTKLKVCGLWCASRQHWWHAETNSKEWCSIAFRKQYEAPATSEKPYAGKCG